MTPRVGDCVGFARASNVWRFPGARRAPAVEGCDFLVTGRELPVSTRALLAGLRRIPVPRQNPAANHIRLAVDAGETPASARASAVPTRKLANNPEKLASRPV